MNIFLGNNSLFTKLRNIREKQKLFEEKPTTSKKYIFLATCCKFRHFVIERKVSGNLFFCSI